MQKLPASGPAREALREKGQFWTPAWLAEAMASWVTANQPSVLFDPAVGPGTFFAAAREVGFAGEFAGFELHEPALAESYRPGLSPTELQGVNIGDFISSRVSAAYPAIISNPPYIRHHRLGEERKRELRSLARHCLGFELDGRVGLHLYFLLKCLDHLAPGGRLAFLLPADVCEGVSQTRSGTNWPRACALMPFLRLRKARHRFQRWIQTRWCFSSQTAPRIRKSGGSVCESRIPETSLKR